jgi:predicted membrane protein
MTHDQSTISDKTSLLLFIISFIIANLNAVTDVFKFIGAFFAALIAVAKFIEWVQTQIQKRNEAKRKGGL